MKRIMNLFFTHKRAIVTSICLFAALAFIGTGTGTALAAGADAATATATPQPAASSAQNSNGIAIAQAKEIALADANVAASEATFTQEVRDMYNGVSVYHVAFYTTDTQYDYKIDAASGTVYSRNTELILAAPAASAVPAATSADNSSSQAAAAITVETAKAAALKDAGVSNAQATFTQVYLDNEHGVSSYDIQFYAAEMRYDYRVNAATGAVYGKSAKPIRIATVAGNGQTDAAITIDAAKAAALKDAGGSNAQATFTQTYIDRDHGVSVYDIEFCTADTRYDYEINAATGAIQSKSAKAIYRTTGNASAGTANASISIEQAQEIAVKHAGAALTDVTVKKVKFDSEDGYAEYEVEFYLNGMEYQYAIDASTGDVIGYESEQNDQDHYDDHSRHDKR